jgi:valyl-tRNA synthetase
MIFSGLEFTGKAPFKAVIVHGTILTKEGKRMSKSLGTGVDPLDMIDKYGADGLRFGLIYQDMGNQDIRFSENHAVMGKKFCNKLWNICRFVVTRVEGKTLIDSYPTEKIEEKSQEYEILKKLKKCREGLDESLKNYRFGKAAHILYDFVWKELADKYIEYSKKSSAEITDLTLIYCLSDVVKMLHPFMPFITEEIWSILPIKNKKKLMVEEWPSLQY